MATEPTKLSYKSLIEWARTSGNGIKADSAISATSATNATTADKLKNARTISLTGAVTGSGSFDGSGNLSIDTVIAKIPTSMPNNASSGAIWIES